MLCREHGFTKVSNANIESKKKNTNMKLVKVTITVAENISHITAFIMPVSISYYMLFNIYAF